MKEKNEKTSVNSWQTIAQKPYVQGPVLGAGVMVAVTPLLNWTNHVMNDKPMVLRNAMSGAVSYASSSAPAYAMVFVVKQMLQPDSKNVTPMHDLLTSFVAGSFSGFVTTPFDAVAQNKQLAKKVDTCTDPRLKMMAMEANNTGASRATQRSDKAKSPYHTIEQGNH